MSEVYQSSLKGHSLQLIKQVEGFYQPIQETIDENEKLKEYGVRLRFDDARARVEVRNLENGGIEYAYHVPIDQNDKRGDGRLWLVDTFTLASPGAIEFKHEREIHFNQLGTRLEARERWKNTARLFEQKLAPSQEAIRSFFNQVVRPATYARALKKEHLEILQANYKKGKQKQEKQQGNSHVRRLFNSVVEESHLKPYFKDDKTHYTWIEDAGDGFSELIFSYPLHDQNESTTGFVWANERFIFYGEDQVLTKVERTFSIAEFTPEDERSFWQEHLKFFYQDRDLKGSIKESLVPNLEEARELISELKPKLNLEVRPEFEKESKEKPKVEKVPLHTPLLYLGQFPEGVGYRVAQLLSQKKDYFFALTDCLEEELRFDLNRLPVQVQVDREAGKTQIKFQYTLAPENPLLISREPAYAMFPEQVAAQEAVVLTETFTIEDGELTDLERSVLTDRPELQAISDRIQVAIQAGEFPQVGDFETRDFIKDLLPQLAGEHLLDVDAIDEIMLADAAEQVASPVAEWGPEAQDIMEREVQWAYQGVDPNQDPNQVVAPYLMVLQQFLGMTLPLDDRDLDLRIGVESLGEELKFRFFYTFQAPSYDGVERGRVEFSEVFTLKNGELQPEIERKVRQVGPDPEGDLSQVANAIEFGILQGMFPNGKNLAAQEFVDSFFPVLVPEKIPPELLVAMQFVGTKFYEEQERQLSASQLYVKAKRMEGLSIPEEVPPLQESEYLPPVATISLKAVDQLRGPLATFLSHPNTDVGFRQQLNMILQQLDVGTITPEEFADSETFALQQTMMAQQRMMGLQETLAKLGEAQFKKAYQETGKNEKGEPIIEIVSPQHAEYGKLAFGLAALLGGNFEGVLEQAEQMKSNTLRRLLKGAAHPLRQREMNLEGLHLIEQIALNQVAKKGLESERWFKGDESYDEAAESKRVVEIFAQAKEKVLELDAVGPLQVLAKLEDLDEEQTALRDALLKDPILKQANQISHQWDRKSRVLDYYNFASGVLLEAELPGAAKGIADYLRTNLLPPSRSIESVNIFEKVQGAFLQQELAKREEELVSAAFEEQWKKELGADSELQEKERWLKLTEQWLGHLASEARQAQKAMEGAEGSVEDSQEAVVSDLTSEEYQDWAALYKKFGGQYNAVTQSAQEGESVPFPEGIGDYLKVYPELSQSIMDPSFSEETLKVLQNTQKQHGEFSLKDFLLSYQKQLSDQGRQGEVAKLSSLLPYLEEGYPLPIEDREARLEVYQDFWINSFMPKEITSLEEIYLPPMPDLPEDPQQEALQFILSFETHRQILELKSVTQEIDYTTDLLSQFVAKDRGKKQIEIRERVAKEVQLQLIGDPEKGTLGKNQEENVGYRLRAFEILVDLLKQEALSHPDNSAIELLNLATDEKLAEYVEALKKALPSGSDRVAEEEKYDRVFEEAKVLREEMKEKPMLKELGKVIQEENSFKRKDAYLEVLKKRTASSEFQAGFVNMLQQREQIAVQMQQILAQKEPDETASKTKKKEWQEAREAILKELNKKADELEEKFDEMLSESEGLPEDLGILANQIFKSISIPQPGKQKEESLLQEQKSFQEVDALLKKFREHEYWKGEEEQGEEGVQLEAQIAGELLFELRGAAQPGLNPAQQLMHLDFLDQYKLQLENNKEELGALEEQQDSEEADESKVEEREKAINHLKTQISNLEQQIHGMEEQAEESSLEDEIQELIMRLHGKTEGWDSVKYFAETAVHQLKKPTTMGAMLMGGVVAGMAEGYTAGQLGWGAWRAGAAGLGANVATFTTTEELAASVWESSRGRWGVDYFKRLGTNALYFGAGHGAGAFSRSLGSAVGRGAFGRWFGGPVKVESVPSWTDSFGRVRYAQVLADGTVPQMTVLGEGIHFGLHHGVIMPGSLTVAGRAAHALDWNLESKDAWKNANGDEEFDWVGEMGRSYAMYGHMLLTWNIAGSATSAMTGRNVPQWIADLHEAPHFKAKQDRIDKAYKDPSVTAPELVTPETIQRVSPVHRWIYQIQNTLGLKNPTEHYEFQLSEGSLWIRQRSTESETQEASTVPATAQLRIREAAQGEQAEAETTAGTAIGSNWVELNSGDVLELGHKNLRFESDLPISVRSHDGASVDIKSEVPTVLDARPQEAVVAEEGITEGISILDNSPHAEATVSLRSTAMEGTARLPEVETSIAEADQASLLLESSLPINPRVHENTFPAEGPMETIARAVPEGSTNSITAAEPVSPQIHPMCVNLMEILAETPPSNQRVLANAVAKSGSEVELAQNLAKSGSEGPALSQAVQWVQNGVMPLEILPTQLGLRAKVAELMEAQVESFRQQGWVEARLKPSDRNLKYQDRSRLNEGELKARYQKLHNKYFKKLHEKVKKAKKGKTVDRKEEEVTLEDRQAFQKELMEALSGVTPLEGMQRAYVLGQQARLLQMRITNAKDPAELARVLKSAEPFFTEIDGKPISELVAKLEAQAEGPKAEPAVEAETTTEATEVEAVPTESESLEPKDFPSLLGTRQAVRDMNEAAAMEGGAAESVPVTQQTRLIMLVNRYLGTKLSPKSTRQYPTAVAKLRASLDQLAPGVKTLLIRPAMRQATTQADKKAILDAYFGGDNVREFHTPEQAVEVLSLLGQAGLNETFYVEVQRGDGASGAQYWLKRGGSPSGIPLAQTRPVSKGQGKVQDALFSTQEVNNFIEARKQAGGNSHARAPKFSTVVHPKGIMIMEWISPSRSATGSEVLPQLKIRFYANLPKGKRTADKDGKISEEAQQFNDALKALGDFKPKGVKIEIQEVDSAQALKDPSKSKLGRAVPIHEVTTGDHNPLWGAHPRAPLSEQYQHWRARQQERQIEENRRNVEVEQSHRRAQEAEKESAQALRSGLIRFARGITVDLPQTLVKMASVNPGDLSDWSQGLWGGRGTKGENTVQVD